MYVIIVGAGKIGSNLALELMAEGHTVTLVEQNPACIAELAETRPQLQVVRGDGCEPAVLESVRIQQADAVVAVTGDDEDNLVVCLLAKREYGVVRTAARVNDPRNEWLFDARFGVDHSVSGTRAMAHWFTQNVDAPPAKA